MTGAPNIVFVFSDQHRHDALGCAGNPVVQTPNLDALAARGTRFTRAYCQSPVCQPSRASVITGRYTHEHGIDTNFEVDLDPAWPTVMKQLRKAGYTTGTFGKTHYYHPDLTREKVAEDPSLLDLERHAETVAAFGWDAVVEEFDRYVHVARGIRTPYVRHLQEHGLYEDYRRQILSVFRLTPHFWDGVTSVLPQEHDLTSFIADQALDWLGAQDGSRPFFLKVAFVQPHVPLIDDPIWAERYRDMAVPFGPRVNPEVPNEIWGRYLGWLHRYSNSDLLTDEYLAEAARHYYGMVSLIDQRVGDIVDLVESRGWSDNTWFVYSADHGEMMGDHNLMAKLSFYRSSVQVPAIVTPPTAPAVATSDALVESIDLAATITAAAGATEVEGNRGRSLLPLMNGETTAVKDLVASAIRVGKSHMAMIATDRWRYTMERNTGTPCELFDLTDDPDELVNRVNDPGAASVATELHEALVAHMA